MDRSRRCLALRAAAVLLVAAIVAVAAPRTSAAQQRSAAELTKVIGRVEVLRKGQTQWLPAVIGANLVEGDDIRAFSGASAELTLPDTSTIVLAENSRLLLSKLEFDQKNQSRTVLIHLAVGKLRAAIAQAAITLVRARQSNFAISTPTAVAAARGTIVWVFTDGTNSVVAVEPQAGIPSRVDCIPLRAGQGGPAGQSQRGVTIFAGTMATDCGTPVNLQPQFLTLNNRATENSSTLTDPAVAAPPVALVLQLITTGLPVTAPTSFLTTPGQGPLSIAPSTFGADVQNNLQNQAPPPDHVTGPPPH
jgi:FecR protein